MAVFNDSLMNNLHTRKARWAYTGKGVHSINTGGVMLAGVKGTLVDFILTEHTCNDIEVDEK
jgi:hypothetical protein